MRCKSALTRIDAARTGELPEAESTELQDHLRSCPSCDESRRDLEGLAILARGLRTRQLQAVTVRDRFGSFAWEGLTIFVAFGPRGIREITSRAATAADFLQRWAARHPGSILEQVPIPAEIRTAIESVLEGADPGAVELDLSGLTEFEVDVLSAIRKIPRGEVRPYRWVAAAVGRPKAIRAVGNVMARNPIPLLLPCHRVVPNGGGIGNYGWGPEVKRRLLRAEGAPVEELDRLKKEGVRFIGSRTTRIFCFPTCKDARRIRKENAAFFRDEAAASKAGYRACARCKPTGSFASPRPYQGLGTRG
ncbi:MAG: methylated-DNA--[protein]-cysteine S-methyltransferase [Acidobacteria bacterium]|nr:methylated-DNA--[protein]-cysteine S-methyltransferase [Acidobacteriota bacterium]